MRNRKDHLLLAAGVLGAFGAGVAAGKMLAKSTAAGTTAAGLPQASLLDTLALALEVFAPAAAKGAIIRRPSVVALAERLELDRRAVQRMQKLRNKYGDGPLMLRLPVRRQAVVLAPEHVHRVLKETPEPFSAASSEKRAALSHFEPQGVLISTGEQRTERRRYNEAVLDHRQAVHRLVDSFIPKVDEEVARMLALARARGELDWDAFAQGWYRLVRRVVFGDVAADDQELNDLTVHLRRAANWAVFHPKDRPAQKRFFALIDGYLDTAEPGSLAGLMAGMPARPDTKPQQQVPQWLFAFDAAGMTTFRALALLAAHPDQMARAREEIRGTSNQAHPQLPFLRAAVLEAVRLWPTTPMVLRQSTRKTRWEQGTMPAGTGVLIYAPFFHRDDQRLPYANRFTPELWLKERSEQDWPLIPFSEGAAGCPGRNLVLLLASSMLARMIEGWDVALAPGRTLNPDKLTGTLDPYTLRFTVGS